MEPYLQEGVFILLSICFLIQLYFLAFNHRKLFVYSIAENLPERNFPVSVIISARNEYDNLMNNLPLILEQNYPDFEVIVVNDCSTDSSASFLLELKEKYNHLKVVTVLGNEKYRTGKKFALTLGIKAAKNEHLLFTDADCVAASANWISRMVANFDENVSIVLGYSPYNKAKKFINPIIRFETIRTAINYFSAAINGNAYMGVGRNLAYTKSLFFDNKGFATHMHIQSGDDDIFVNQNATFVNTAVEMHPESYMYTVAKSTLGEWFAQKKRHFGAGKFYKGKHRFVLSLDAITGLLFYIAAAYCLIFNFEPLIVIGFFIFRLLIQLIVYSKLFKRFVGYYLLFYFPILDMAYYFYLNIFGLIGAFTKNTEWK